MRNLCGPLLVFLFVIAGCDTTGTTIPEPSFDAEFATWDSTVFFSGDPAMSVVRLPRVTDEVVLYSLNVEADVDGALLNVRLSHYSAGGFSSNATYAVRREVNDGAGRRCAVMHRFVLSGEGVGSTCTSVGFTWREADADSLTLYLPVAGEIAIDVAGEDEVSGTLAITFDRAAEHAANRVYIPEIPGFEPSNGPEPLEVEELTEAVTLEAQFTGIPRELLR